MEQSGVGGTAHAILNLLKRRGQASVVNLSEELGLSGMAIRHHLSSLRSKGYVHSKHERHGIGRPTEIFHLTELGDELFPRHYDKLANDILKSIESIQGKKSTEEIFSYRTQRKLEEHSKKLEGLPLEQKVSVVADILTEEGFLADYEKRGDGYILNEHNCAVRKIAEQYQQVCACELKMIEELLDADVERKEHRLEGGHRCSYYIKPRAEL